MAHDGPHRILKKLSDGWLGAEPSTLSSAEPSRADEIPSQQRLHSRLAASTVSSQNDAQDSNIQRLQHQTDPPPNKSTASLILLKQRQLLGTSSDSRRRSSGLPLVEDTSAFIEFETSAPQTLRHITMPPSQADEPNEGTSHPPPLLTVLPIDGIPLPISTVRTNDAIIYHHPYYTRSSSLSSQPADHSSIERLQPAIVIRDPRKSMNGPAIASNQLPTSPAQIHSVSYAATDVESEAQPEATRKLCTALPPPREIRTSQYSSMELLSGGDNRGVGMSISARRSYSLDTNSPSSLSSSGNRSILPSSASSDASSVYSGSQPESPQSVLQSSVGFRSLPVIGSLFSSMHNKSAVCRKGAPAGIKNLGNTCFASSVLQCLRAVPSLKAAICAAVPAGHGRATPVVSELAQLLNSMEKAGPRIVISPARLLDALAARDERWWGGDQQDAQEFLQALLEALQEEAGPAMQGAALYRQLSGQGTESHQAASAWLATAKGWPSSQLGALLGGQLQSTVTCTVCKGASHCFDRFTDLSLPIPRHYARVTLQECLNSFTAAEEMPAEDGFRCSICHRQQPASKRLSIRRCPAVLILSLKRFASTSMAGGFASCTKDASSVRIPPDVLSLKESCSSDLSSAELVSDPPVYDLMGAVSHTGSIDGGHYTATVRGAASSAEHSKGLQGGQWYHCSDEHVELAGPPGSQDFSQAYLLLYVRRGGSNLTS